MNNYRANLKKLAEFTIDSIFIARPIILIPVWGYFILGYYAKIELPTHGFLLSINTTAWISLAAITLSVASTYILNQIADIATDSHNGGMPLIAKGGFPIKAAKIICVITAILPLLTIALNKHVFLFILLASLLNILYNIKPFYFTGRPFLDFLTNATGFGIVAFGLGWVSACNGQVFVVIEMLIRSFPYFLLMIAGSINSTMPDANGDSITGKITTVVYLGESRSNLISLTALFASLIVALINMDFIAILASVIALPLFISYQISPSADKATATYTYGGGFLLLIIALLTPGYLLAGIIVLIATKIYFRLRHNVKYP